MGKDLVRIRSVADYQFGKGIGARLFPDSVEILHSQRTGRIRYIYLENKRLATMRPTDGLFSLSIDGAKRVLASPRIAECIVAIKDDVTEFVTKGGDVFAVHVVGCGSSIRSRDEVIVVDRKGVLLAVGRAALSSEEMLVFKRGVAVHVRRGNASEG